MLISKILSKEQSKLSLVHLSILDLTFSVFILVGMMGSNAPRPTMPSGDWGTQGAAVRVTCAPTTSAMNRPIQGGMIRNPTSSLPMRPNSQPGPRQMLQSQVMNMGKLERGRSLFHF